MPLIDRSVADLLAAFRSPDPTPGGGSAAALAGAVGASLLAMVAGLPKSQAVTEEDTARLRAAGECCTAAATQLAALVDRDSDAYDAVMAAYKAPKGTDEEKTARTAGVQRAMQTATDTPLNVMRECAAAAGQGVVIAALGNRSAASDVRVGFELLAAGLRGARANVNINLGSIKDQTYLGQVQADAEKLALAIEHDSSAAAEALGG